MCEQKHIIKMESEYLHCETTVGVVIPTQIEKLLVLLHGYNGSFKHLDENLPLVEYAYNNNMIIVIPNMNNGYYMNKSDYRVNEFLLLELIPLVFNTYGLKEELPMYIAGISMGGYGSLLIGSAFPSEFKKIVSISGAFIAHDVAIGNPQVVGGLGDKEALKYFTDTFAPFDTLENDIYRNPVAAIIDCNCNEDVVPELIITCGTKDELYARNLDVLRTFCKYGVAYDWLPIEGGIHDYKSFDAGLRYAFKMLEE